MNAEQLFNTLNEYALYNGNVSQVIFNFTFGMLVTDLPITGSIKLADDGSSVILGSGNLLDETFLPVYVISPEHLVYMEVVYDE